MLGYFDPKNRDDCAPCWLTNAERASIVRQIEKILSSWASSPDVNAPSQTPQAAEGFLATLLQFQQPLELGAASADDSPI